MKEYVNCYRNTPDNIRYDVHAPIVARHIPLPLAIIIKTTKIMFDKCAHAILWTIWILLPFEAVTQHFHLNEYLTNTYSNKFVKIWKLDKSPQFPETALFDPVKRTAFIGTIKKGHVTIEGNQFQIGVIDVNSNDVYNEFNVDMVILFVKQIDSMRIDLMYSAMNYYEQYMKLRINGIDYEIDSLAEDGQSITISEVRKSNSPVAITFNSMIPSAEFNQLGESLERVIIPNSGKYNIVQLWHSNCSGCVRSFEKLNKISVRYEDKITIIGLNPIDDQESFNHSIEKYEINYLNYICRKEYLKELGLVNWYPSYVLFDGEGNLISNTMDLKEMMHLFNFELD